MLRFINLFGALRRQRRAAAAVEFALTGMALFAFLLGIVNLGYLGLTLGLMQHAVEAAARQAATAAAANLGGVGATTSCPTASNIQGYFNNYGAPLLSSSNVNFSYGAGTTTNPWVTNDSVSPGSYLTLTATYTWKPAGFASLLPSGLPFSLTAAAFVMGSSNTVKC